MIDINDITVQIGTKVLLEHASAHISDGWKVGLVGANGCGKSTLYRVLQGGLETETGDVFFPAQARVAYVEQEFSELETSVLDFVLSRDSERADLLERLKIADETELASIHERLNFIGAAAAPARAASILRGLGFSEKELSRPVKEFSGGWRMRLALAAALFRPSDILLLDEPTNHLDLEAGLWLEEHLQKYRGTLLIISHDRNILNVLCNYIIHFDHGKLVTYSGNYDTFRKTRALQQEVLSRQAEKVEQHRKHMQSFVDRFRYKATKAKQAQSRLKMLEKLENVTLLEDDPSTHFHFPVPLTLSPPVLTVEDGVVGYDDRPILKKLNLQIVDNDRIALLGANGNGKSTLAKLIAGRLPLMGGSLRRASKLKVGYFAQHQSEELPLEETPTQFMLSLVPEWTETQARSHLAAFGLGQEKAITTIKRLSGGEKARLLFAAMTFDAPSLLILDEPTNHLDIDGRDALIQALNDYSGSVILITHDLHLIELLADELWLVKDGTCKVYNGDLEDYRRLLLGQKTLASSKPQKVSEPVQPKVDTRALKKELSSRQKRVERELDKLQQRKTELESQFCEQLAPTEIIEIQKELGWVAKQYAEFEEEWLEVSGRLEEL